MNNKELRQEDAEKAVGGDGAFVERRPEPTGPSISITIKCPVCGSEDTEPDLTTIPTSLAHCKACGNTFDISEGLFIG